MCYEGKPVLCGLSFGVNKGEFVSIIGENGSGKSTLIKGILGILKHKGTLELNLKPCRIGYLPQQTPAAEDFPVTAFEVALSGCLNNTGFPPFYKEKHRRKAREALSKMNASALEKRRFRDLSAGQRQRVLIARALCAAEELLLLDEPATGLDPNVRSELYELVGGLNKTHGMTIIMISHDIRGAVENADKILHINAGGSFFCSAAEYKETDIYKETAGKDNQ